MEARYEFPQVRTYSDASTGSSAHVIIEMSPVETETVLEQAEALLPNRREEISGGAPRDGTRKHKMLRKKNAARYPQNNRYGALVRQRRWWKNRENHIVHCLAIGIVVVILGLSVLVVVWADKYQRSHSG